MKPSFGKLKIGGRGQLINALQREDGVQRFTQKTDKAVVMVS